MTTEQYWKLRYFGEQMQRANERRESVAIEVNRLCETATAAFQLEARTLGLDPTKNIAFNNEQQTAVNTKAEAAPSPAPPPAPVLPRWPTGKRRRRA